MNLLLTSVGRRSYLVEYFKNVLGNCGKVYVANSSPISPAFLCADEAVVVPEIYDTGYITFLLELCREKDIRAIIPLFDIDLPILAGHKEEFRMIGTEVIVSDIDFVNICNDKWATYNYLRKNGISTPKTYQSLADAKKDLNNEVLRYPVIIKPRWGMGSIAVYQADNEEEMEVFYNKTQKEIKKTYLKYESAQNMQESVLIQEKIDGQEYGMDVINDLQGEYVNAIVKLKKAMRSGETDCALTVEDTDIYELGKRIAKISHHIANLDVDIMKTKNGENYIIEMNARFGGGYPFSHLAGVNLPKAIINWLLDKPVEKDAFTPKVGVLGQKDIRIVELSNAYINKKDGAWDIHGK